jgi:iron complex outermembrane recepter protein
MTRSRRRKLMRAASRPAARSTSLRTRLPLASAVLAAIPAAFAQQAQPQSTGAETTGGLEEIVVTAQKRTENLQDVPISIQTLGSQQLEELHISDIDDYVKYLSGVTTVKGLGQGGTGIGTTHTYMRGVVSGQDGNHSASQPSVGTYIDELPITTIDGTPDIHVYDIARIEVLEGPQGTLYGASSEAGTIRIITNKPDLTKFSASYDLTGNTVDHGGQGWIGEGYVNFPLSPIAAIRLVAWDEHDAGYIHNVAGTNATAGIVDGVRTYPTSGDSVSNAGFVDSQYNTVDTEGGRATLLLKLGDNWTVTPQFIGQQQNSNGVFAFDPAVGDLDLVHYGPEGEHDTLTQTSLTVEGNISNFDLTYAGGWFDRNEHTVSDYSDYTYFYDKFFGSGCNWLTQTGYNYVKSHGIGSYCSGAPASSFPAGSFVPDPQEFVITNGHYTKWSHELRLSTPQELPVKGIVGLFAERQVHEIWEQYTIPGDINNPEGFNPTTGLAPSFSIPGVSGNTVWLTDEERVDRDSAAFGQMVWDITQQWSVTGGIRFYHYDNSIQGFYGYSANYQAYIGAGGYTPGPPQSAHASGQWACGPVGVGGNPTYEPFHGAPCTDLNQDVSDSGRTYKANLTYKFDRDKLLYFTYSTGFRPGGVNRVYNATLNEVYPPYQTDTLVNYEIGWKTQWLDHTLRWNAAAFLENWDNFQFLFLGPNSVTVVQNAASAQIKGFESDLQWAPLNNLFLSSGFTYLHAVTTTNYCGPAGTGGASNYLPGTTILTTNCPNQVINYADGVTLTGPEAPSGSQLPVAPKVKLNVVARYLFPLGSWEGFSQLSGMYQTSTEPLLRRVDQLALGEIPAYALFDFSAGASKNNLTLQLIVNNIADKRAELTRYVECATTTCGPQPYAIPTQPRTLSLRISQKF